MTLSYLDYPKPSQFLYAFRAVHGIHTKPMRNYWVLALPYRPTISHLAMQVLSSR